jgi:hypothetical protein
MHHAQPCHTPPVGHKLRPICGWQPRDTGYHDHTGSCVGVHVIECRAWNEPLTVGGPPEAREYGPGETFWFPGEGIHRMDHQAGAVTIHVYSPPIRAIGHYEPRPRQRVEDTFIRPPELEAADRAVHRSLVISAAAVGRRLAYRPSRSPYLPSPPSPAAIVTESVNGGQSARAQVPPICALART